MASTVAKPAVPTDTMATAPVFSYAQAARGQVGPPTASQPDNYAPPSNSSLGKDDNASTTNTIATSAASSNASDIQDLPKALQESTDLSHLKNSDSELSSVVGSVGQDSRDDAASAAGSQSQGHSKGAGSSAVASQAGDAPDSRKSRKGKKGKGPEKDGDQEKIKESLKVFEPPKAELSEAPIPTVNIWHQRKEERAAATVKPATTVPAKSVAAGAESPADSGKVPESKKPGPSSTDESSEPGNKASSSAANARAPRRPVDSTRVTPAHENAARRNAPRGSRMQGKDDRTSASENPPPVQDASLWPSIELAAADEAKKKASEKPEQSERPEDGATAKPRPKKEWVAVPITPTFTYETQFTHPKQPRTRGGGRGGRETGIGRGGHVPQTNGSPAEKDTTTTTGAPPKPTSESRERARDAPTATGPNPRQTPQALGVPKRGVPDSSAREQRKTPGVPTNEKPKPEYGAAPYPPKGEAPTRGPRPELGNGDQHHVDRRRQSADRREPRSHDSAADNGNSHPVREARGERGRGGYRGRGGANHNGSGHHQQSSYGGNGQRYMGGSGGIGSQPFSPTANQYQQFSGHTNGNRRVPVRAQTGPSHNGQRPQNGGAGPGRMPSLPIPASNPEYPVQAFQPAYVNPGYGGEDYILQGLKQQIEYYFSPDNLLRDIYLRARMDSQGYVLLKTIAQFKRVQQLAPRYDFIQAACVHSQEVDYVVGEDGLERLRSRRDMTPFIFDMQKRVDESKNNGPTSVVYQNLDRQPPYGNGFGHPMYTASPTAFHPEFHQNGGEHAHPMYAANGVHFAAHGAIMGGDYSNGPRYNGESQLSANVPDFSPISHQRPSLEAFQRFQDADIPKLKVILDDNKPRATTNGTAPAPEEGSAGEHLPNGASAPATSSSETPEADHPAPSDSPNYADFHQKALGQRQNAAPGETPPEMHNLYKFWLDLLSNTFNVKLYNEFRQLAIEDGTKQPASAAGVQYLVAFYEAVFDSRRSYPEDLDVHYQEAKNIVDSVLTVPNGAAQA